MLHRFNANKFKSQRYFLKLIFIEVQLLYNVVLISAVQQSESVMSINRGMDKEDVVHIDNGISLSHKKGMK